eukprot:TRINITY_DN5060_c0_g1_i3.p1 TRINITY_DN5060_c0_g1~~TRINITY_DN5060_c0_g1_i3.p1  ORF type:complete len:194 (+),score=36.48 TRINITY_DN5060_c0_g1_i3:69-650(+)
MMSRVAAILFAFLAVAIVAINAKSTQSLDVTKTVTPGNGVFTVQVGYKLADASQAGRLFGVTIIDSIPSTLDLVSGELVVKGEDPTEEWTYNTYTVRTASKDFTIEKRNVNVDLPAAEVIYSQSAGSAVTNHTTYTNHASIDAELIVPKGSISAAPVIAFFTLLFPLAVAVYLIPYFRRSELEIVKAQRNKKK